MTARRTTYATPVEHGSETALLLRWVDGLYRTRSVRGVSHCLSIGEHSVILSLAIEEPTVAVQALLDLTFDSPPRPFLLARLWALPGCCAGIAQDLDRPVDEVRAGLEELQDVGLAFEHRGIWRALAWSPGGKA